MKMMWVGKLAIIEHQSGTLRLRVIYILNVSFSSKIYFRFRLLHLIYRRCLNEYVKGGQNVSLSYNFANRLVHLIYFLNR
jgi:hypothetical protein